MAYVPPHTPMMRKDWPTLKELLDSGKRLVVFMDKGAEDGSVPYLLPQFTMVCTVSPSHGNPFLNGVATHLFRCGKMNTIPLTVNFPAKSTALLVLFTLPSSST